MSILIDTKHFKVPYPLSQGKARDVYDLGGQLLIIATDRLSAFDVVLPTPIPGKGKVLTAMTLEWLRMLENILPNLSHAIPVRHHFISSSPDDLPSEFAPYHSDLDGRMMLVEKCAVIPYESIVRGHITGSLKSEFDAECTAHPGAATVIVHGQPFPASLVEADLLPRPIFTPSTKAEQGAHDQNISFEDMGIGLHQWVASGADKEQLRTLAELVRRCSICVYEVARLYARARGVIIADTKFEWGLAGTHWKPKLVLVDEVLTPDSSRFWPADGFCPGKVQPSFDKQFVREYLKRVGWDKCPPAPALPAEIVEQTTRRYLEAADLMFGITVTV